MFPLLSALLAAEPAAQGLDFIPQKGKRMHLFWPDAEMTML
jgi:hypothetical protein